VIAKQNAEMADWVGPYGGQDPDRSIFSGAHDPAPIGAKNRRPHHSLEATQRLADRTLAFRIPNPHPSINLCAQNPASIGAESRGLLPSLVANEAIAFAIEARCFDQCFVDLGGQGGGGRMKLAVAAEPCSSESH
jgi:hypothetical protein